MTEPALGWFHVGYDMVQGSVHEHSTYMHHHIQEAREYPGLRFVWSLNAITGERSSKFYIRDVEYPTLTDAIKAWKSIKRKRERVRL